MGRDALVVDDDGAGREALAAILQAHGYTVRTAENGRVALDRIAEHVPFLMVLDLDMPVMTGWEVLASTRRDPGLRAMIVVVVSGEPHLPAGVRCLGKPCAIAELFEAVAACGADRD